TALGDRVAEAGNLAVSHSGPLPDDQAQSPLGSRIGVLHCARPRCNRDAEHQARHMVQRVVYIMISIWRCEVMVRCHVEKDMAVKQPVAGALSNPTQGLGRSTR